MTQPIFGISITRDDNEPRPVVTSDMSVIGIVGTADDADAAVFPLNKPVLIFSSNVASLAALGATGTIADAIPLINAQLAGFQASAKIVVVRVAAGATAAETMANIIGTEAGSTGIYALLRAGPALGVIPRLIIAPGYTHQCYGGIASASDIAGGTGYTSAPAVTFTGGTPVKPAVATATVLGGAVTGLTFTDRGQYLTPPTIVFTGAGTGASAIAVLEQLANPVAVALVPVLERLTAHAVIEGPGTNSTDIKTWRESLQSSRLIPVDVWSRVMEGTDLVTIPGVPSIVGLAVRRDFEFGGVPGHSWANQAVQGIVGPARFVDFSLTDGATEGQDLLANNIGILLRGELGVETAISSSGFVFIGTDNAADDPLWQFYNITRLRDYIHLGLLRTTRFYLGKFNLTGQTIQAILNTMGFFMRDLHADGHILGYRVGFEKDKNSPENLRLGHFRCFFEAEEPAPLRRIDIDSRRYRPALEAMLESLMSSTSSISG